MKGFVPTPQQTVDLMVSMLFEERKPRPQETILDPGCGNGAFIEGIVRWCVAHHTPIPNILGIDSDPRRIQEARIKLRQYKSVRIVQDDFLSNAVSKQFSFIIGNPPYVPITGLSERERAIYRSRYQTAHGRFDLYLLFFEKALSLLLPRGRLVFITPEKYLYVDSAASLRRLLGGFQVRSIQLANEDTFPDLVTYPTITEVVNSSEPCNTTALLRDGMRRQVSFPADGKSWWPAIHGVDPRQGEPAGQTLRDLCVRISCGVATGADSVFVLPTNQLAVGLRAFAYPTISGRQLITTAPGLPTSTHSLLIPYAPEGNLLKEKQLNGFRTYLTQHQNKQKLLQRTCATFKPWYAFHENPPLPEILRPKILCKDISPVPRFWVDRSGSLVPRHSVYYIVPKHADHIDNLCQYLNSEQVATWLTTHCQRAANGFLRLQSQVLKQLPIPRGFNSNHKS
jgi:adenine-specific DNA-methyltransferase